MTNQSSNQLMFILVLVLMVVFASRVQFLTDTPLHRDEARSGMRMMGTFDEIILWQPPDWPPLHNILLGGWSSIAGEYPFSLRVFSAFISLLSVAISYPMALRLTHNRRIALGTMVFYASLGMSLYLGVFIRGYILVLALLPLAILMTARYFESHRWRDAVGLAITMGLMFISTYTSVVAFVFLILLARFKYKKHRWRWMIIGILASPFALVELLRKWDYWFSRAGSSNLTERYVYDFVETFITHYQDYFGHAELYWIFLIGLAIVLWLWNGHQHLHLFLWAILACMLAPLITFALVESRIFVLMTTRYSWWVLIIFALGLSIGLHYLPRLLWMVVLTVCLGLMLIMPMVNIYYGKDAMQYQYEDNMEWLSQHLQLGDVLMFDPNFCIEKCNNLDELAYYWDTYLDDCLALVNDPTGHRRVWVWRGGGHSRELLKSLSQTHVTTVFFGPPTSLLELYEAPPNPEGILYENGMRFHGFDIINEDGTVDLPPYNLREQTPMKIRLWWSADRPIETDYQVSVQILDAQTRTLFTQDDSSPQLIHLKPNAFEPLPASTRDWLPNQLYVDERVIEMPAMTSEMTAEIYLIVYSLAGGERVKGLDMLEYGILPLSETIIWGWG